MCLATIYGKKQEDETILLKNASRIDAVILVPILAPMMIPIACFNFIIPELTKPMTITVVAEDD